MALPLSLLAVGIWGPQPVLVARMKLLSLMHLFASERACPLHAVMRAHSEDATLLPTRVGAQHTLHLGASFGIVPSFWTGPGLLPHRLFRVALKVTDMLHSTRRSKSITSKPCSTHALAMRQQVVHVAAALKCRPLPAPFFRY